MVNRTTWLTICVSAMLLGACGEDDDGASSAGGAGAGGSGLGAGGAGASTATGGSGGVPPLPSGPLEGLPSTEGAHIAEIQALGDGQWLELGPPAPDPVFGMGRGRSWGGRSLILASALRGAFFFGEGVHAYVKPDGYAMDDLFFYDVNAHRWIAVYPGMHVASFNQRVRDGALAIDDDGQLVDETGQPIPVHTLIHAWDLLSYDPIGQKFAFLAGNGLGRYFLPGEPEMDEGLTALEAELATITVPPMSPWFYDVASGRFERYPITGPVPDSVQNQGTNFGNFVFIPSQQRYFYGSAEGVAFFDPTSRAWTVTSDSGPRPEGYDLGGCYDPTRERVYMGTNGGPGLHIYDLATDTWTLTSTQGPAPNGVGTNGASVFYDTANDVVTVFHYADATIFTYAPEADSWSSQPLSDAVLSAVGYPSFNAFYDPVLNAYFVHAATDSEDNGVFWAYRYQAP